MRRNRLTTKIKNNKLKIVLGSVVLLYLCIVTRFTARNVDFFVQNDARQDKAQEDLEVRVTRRRKVSSREQQPQDPAALLPNWPFDFLASRRFGTHKCNATCAKLPSFFNLKMNNLYWQHVTLKENDINIYLYSAYFDERSEVTSPTPSGSIRLLGMMDRFLTANDQMPTSLCQLWYDDELVPTFTEAARYTMLWQLQWGYNPANQNLLPVLVTCPLPSDGRLPTVVSLVTHPCDNASNALTVQGRSNTSNGSDKRSSSGRIAVCVKGMLYPYDDRSARLVEWLELLKLLGADRVVVYLLAVHPNVSRVLEHYAGSGIVETIALTLPGDLFNGPDLLPVFFKKRGMTKRQNELIPYNDCLYRNRKQFEYVLLLDMDEVILPTKSDTYTWQDMLRKATSDVKRVSSICARNCFFFENATAPDEQSDDVAAGEATPPYMHILNHLYRSYNHSPAGHFVKCFHSTATTVALHNHLPLRCLAGECDFRHLDTDVGQLQHYRRSCTAGLEQDCQSHYMNYIVKDGSVLKYGAELVGKVKSVLQALNLL